jgi:cGMP-dependent protein kinase 2
MLDEPRHANVIALTPLKCLTLDRNQFIELLGPLSEVLSRQMRIRILRR